MTRVFVSYSFERDRVFMEAFRLAVRTTSWVELLDPASVTGAGSEVASEIRSQIEACDIAVCVVGSDRPNILLETGLALGARKEVLLVVRAADDLPSSLRSVPVIVASDDPRADAARIVRRLSDMRPLKSETAKTYGSAFDQLSAYRNDPAFFEAIAPRAFEGLIAEIFAQQGFEVSPVSSAVDAGFDIMMRSPESRRVCVVQVKKYSRQSRVAIGQVRELLGAAVLNHADVGILVTSSKFTPGAVAMAAQTTTPRMILITMDRLLSDRGIEEVTSSLKPSAAEDARWESIALRSLSLEEQVNFLREDLVPAVRNRAYREWENLAYANIEGKVIERTLELAEGMARELGLGDAWALLLRSSNPSTSAGVAEER